MTLLVTAIVLLSLNQVALTALIVVVAKCLRPVQGWVLAIKEHVQENRDKRGWEGYKA